MGAGMTASVPFIAWPTQHQRDVAYNAGKSSAINGKDQRTNPYWPADQRHADWLLGHARGVEQANTVLEGPAYIATAPWPVRATS